MAVTLGSACSISQVWGEQGAQAVSRVGCYKRVLARKKLSDTFTPQHLRGLSGEQEPPS